MHIDPIEHAAQEEFAKNKEKKMLAASEKMYSHMIYETLNNSIRKLPHQSLGVPSTIQGKINLVPLCEVVADEVSDGDSLEALMTVLQLSDCPHVASLRKSMSDHYIYINASWIAACAQ